MARILVIYTNTYRMIAPAPLGASLVAARLRRDGHEVRLLDLMFSRSPAQEAARFATAFRPDLVCYSIRNVDNQSYTQFSDPLPSIQAIAAAVRKEWPAPSLLGGTAFTTFPEQFLDALGADYGIAGDDLEPISSFVASLLGGKPDLSTPGLVYRDSGSVRRNPFKIKGYGGIAFDGWDFMSIRPYRRQMSNFWDAAVVPQTGCPFNCVFCDTGKTFGKQRVLRDPSQVAEEVMTLQRKHGARSIFLADAGFNRPLEHGKAVLEAIASAGSKATVTGVFEPGEVDEELARLYRRAGGRYAMLFAFSLSERVLDACRKPCRSDDVFHDADVLKRAGVENMLYLTFGGPGETPSTVEETISSIPRTHSLYTLVDHGFRIQPDTELHRRAVSEGAISPTDDCFTATFYHSPETPPDFLDARLKRYQAGTRWSSFKALPFFAGVMWEKLRP
ncbi:MAG TPA: radical SAM protein [Chloroflexota bacterium]